MKTQSELDAVALAITNSFGVICLAKDAVKIRKLLRSIELDAWREARELVDKHEVCDDWYMMTAPNPAIYDMDRIIQQLQLK